MRSPEAIQSEYIEEPDFFIARNHLPQKWSIFTCSAWILLGLFLGIRHCWQPPKQLPAPPNYQESVSSSKSLKDPVCFFFANLLRSHDLQEGTLESSSIIPNPWKDQCSYAILWSFQLWLFWLKGMEESSQLDPMEQVVNGTSSPLCADARRGQAPCGLYGGSGGCKSCPVALSVTFP